MGIIDKLKKSLQSKKQIKDAIFLKEDPTQQIPYQIKDGKIHFGEFNIIDILGVDLKIGNVRTRLSNWKSFHIFVMGLISGWEAIGGMIQLRDSLNKGNTPDILKNCDEKTLEEIKNYNPPKNYFDVLNKLDKMDKTETDKIIEIKKILGNEKLLAPYVTKQIDLLFELVKKQKNLNFSKNEKVGEINSLVYQKPVFSVVANELELKLIRFFILRDEISLEHAELILPIVHDFLYGTIINQPGKKIPRETIEIEIHYFKEYIELLEKSIKDKSPIKVLFVK